MTNLLFNTILLGDGRLPTGGYSDSAGLEPAVNAGLEIEEAFPYMMARLRTITKMEAAACVLAYRFAKERATVDPYSRLEDAVDARTPSAAQRKASRSMGRASLYLAKNLKLDDEGISTLDRLPAPPTRGVALGVVGAALDVSEENCTQVCCYDDMQRIAEAILKLLPTDPALVTRWLIDAGEKVDPIVKAARNIEKPCDLPAVSAPWMEQWAEEHDQRTKRLFMA